MREGENKIEYSKKFLKSLSKLPKHIQCKAKVKEAIFKINLFDSRLDTHKLHGKKQREWSFSVDHSYRIIFIFLNGEKVLYIDIGTHNTLY